MSETKFNTFLFRKGYTNCLRAFNQSSFISSLLYIYINIYVFPNYTKFNHYKKKTKKTAI